MAKKKKKAEQLGKTLGSGVAKALNTVGVSGTASTPASTPAPTASPGAQAGSAIAQAFRPKNNEGSISGFSEWQQQSGLSGADSIRPRRKISDGVKDTLRAGMTVLDNTAPSRLSRGSYEDTYLGNKLLEHDLETARQRLLSVDTPPTSGHELTERIQSVRSIGAAVRQQQAYNRQFKNEQDYNNQVGYAAKYKGKTKAELAKAVEGLSKATDKKSQAELAWLQQHQYDSWTQKELDDAIKKAQDEADNAQASMDIFGGSAYRNSAQGWDWETKYNEQGQKKKEAEARRDALRAAKERNAYRDELAKLSEKDLKILSAAGKEMSRMQRTDRVTGLGHAISALAHPDKDPVEIARKRLKELGYDRDQVTDLLDYATKNANAIGRKEFLSAIQDWERRSDWNKAVGSVVSVPLNVLGGAPGYADVLIQGALGGQDAFTGDHRLVDWNSGMTIYSDAANTMRETASEDMHPVARFFYNAGMSMADSAAAMATGEYVGEALLGSSAAIQAAKEAHERGATDAQALGVGMTAGFMEAAFEHIPMGRLRKMTDTVSLEGLSWKDFAKFAKFEGTQGLTEALEEGGTTGANLIWDEMIMGDKSQIKTAIKEYMADGMSEDKATRQAWKDWGTGLVTDMAAGFVSGVGMGGGSVAIGKARYNGQTSRIGREVEANAENLSLVADGFQFPEGSRTKELADSLVADIRAGKKPTAKQYGELVRAREADVAKGMTAVPNATHIEIRPADNGNIEVVTVQGKTAEALQANGLSASDAVAQGRVLDQLVSGETVSDAELKKLDVESPAVQKVFSSITGAEMPADAARPALEQVFRKAGKEYSEQMTAANEALEREGEALEAVQQAFDVMTAENAASAQEQAAQVMADAQAAVAAEAPVEAAPAQEEAPVKRAETREEFNARKQAEVADLGWELTDKQLDEAWRKETSDGIALSDGGAISREEFYDEMREYFASAQNVTPTDEQLEGLYQKARAAALNGGAMTREAWEQAKQPKASEEVKNSVGDSAIEANEPVADKAESLEQELSGKLLETALKSKGVKSVQFSDKVPGNVNAHINPKTGVITVNKSLTTQKAIYWAVGHEITHGAVEGEYGSADIVDEIIRTFQDLQKEKALKGGVGSLANDLVMDVDAAVAEKQKTYREFFESQGMSERQIAAETTPEKMREEIAADLMGFALASEDILNRLSGEKPKLIVRALRAVRNLFQSENVGDLLSDANYRATKREIDRLTDRLSSALDQWANDMSSGATESNGPVDAAAEGRYNIGKDNITEEDSNGRLESQTQEGVRESDSRGSSESDQAGVPGVREGRRADSQRLREESGALPEESRNGQRPSSKSPVDARQLLLSPESKSKLQRSKVYADVYDTTADPAAFSSALDAARESDVKNGWAVTPKTEQELRDSGATLIMADGNTAGLAVTPSGDIEALFSNKVAGAPKGISQTLLPLAIEAGGRKLDCYGPGLARVYSKFGFVPVARTEFNPEYANPGWTPDKGQPDIYFMMYTGPASADAVVNSYGTYPALTADQLDTLPLMDYDAAAAYRDEQLAKADNENSKPSVKYSAGKNPLADLDRDYAAAVESGDMETAQRMVDEAAKRAGYQKTGFHGTLNGGFTQFDKHYAHPNGNSGAGFYFSSNKSDSESHYADVEGADNYFKAKSLAEQIIDMGEWDGEPVDDWDDALRIAKEELKRNPMVYNTFLDLGRSYVRNGYMSTNIYDDLMRDFDYESATDDEDGGFQRITNFLRGKVNAAVEKALDAVQNEYEVVSGEVDPEKLARQILLEAVSSEKLDFDTIYREADDFGIELLKDDWIDSSDGTAEVARAIIEAFGYDSITDKEAAWKFNQVMNMGDEGSGTEHYIVFHPEQIKSADPITYDDNGNVIPLSERFNPENPDIRYSISGPVQGLYNLSERVIGGMKQDKFGAASVVNMLRGKGVKAEEIKWLGIEDFLKGKKSVTKQELLDYIRANDLVLEETTLSDDSYAPAAERSIDQTTGELYEDYESAYSTLYDRMAEQGYDEGTIEGSLLFDDNFGFYWNDPETGEVTDLAILAEPGNTFSPTRETHWSGYTTPGGTNYRELLIKMPSSKHTNAASERHWRDQAPGVMAHARVQDFTDTAGRPLLFVEEIQSDWHNEGQENGYQTKGTESPRGFRLLELERAYDTADTQNRAALRKEIRELQSEAAPGVLEAMDAMRQELDNGPAATVVQKLAERRYSGNTEWAKNNFESSDHRASWENLSRDGFIDPGDIWTLRDWHERFDQLNLRWNQARWALREEGHNYEYRAPDAPFAKNYTDFVLKRLLREAAENGYDGLAWTTAQMQADRWSDEYMEGYRIEYDQDIPKFLNKFGKKFGAKVGWTEIDSDGETLSVPYLPITDEMRASVLENGLPKFSVRGRSPAFDAWMDSLTKPVGTPQQRSDVARDVFKGYGMNGKPTQPAAPRASKVKDNTYKRMGIKHMFTEEHARAYDEADMTYDPVSEQESMRRADERLTADYDGEKAKLNQQDWRSGEDLDTAMGILVTELRVAKDTGNYDEVLDWMHTIREQGTKAGQFIQAFAKYNRTPEGILVRAAEDLEDVTRLTPQQKEELLGKIATFAKTLNALRPNADGTVANPNGLVDLIVEQAKQRNTPVPKHVLKALKREVKNGEVQYLYDFALTQLGQITKDYIPASLGKKVAAFQTIAHLFNLRTGGRNLVSNTLFGSLAATANNVAMIPDTVLSLMTGGRSVGFDAGHFHKSTWQGIKNGGSRSRIEVALDVDPDINSHDKYGTSRRTWKMTGNWVQRNLSRVEKAMAYELNWTDEFRKGGVRAEIIHSLAPLVEKGTISMETAKAWAEDEALYRTFQDDTYINKLLAGVKKVLNTGLVTEYDANGGKHVRVGQLEFGLGDIVQKYTQVPGALLTRAIEFAPTGYAKAFYHVARLVRQSQATKKANAKAAEAAARAEAAQAGTKKARADRAAAAAFRAAKSQEITTRTIQREAALAFGRAMTGTGLIAFFAAITKAGLLRRDDDEVDANAKALRTAEGVSGTQLNFSALERLVTGGSAEWQQGDILMDVGFLEPINNLMTMGAKISGDDEDANAWDYTLDTFDALYRSMLEIPTMQTAQTIYNTAKYHQEDSPLPVWAEIPIEVALSGAGGFVPAPIRQLAQATDPYYRDTYASRKLGDRALASIQNNIPFWRKQLPTKLDSFGRDREQEAPALNAANAFLIPGAVRTYKPDAVANEVLDFYERTGEASILPARNAPYTVETKSGKKELTAEERRAYQQTVGGIEQKEMGKAIANKEYKKAPKDVRADVWRNLKSYATAEGKRKVGGKAEIPRWTERGEGTLVDKSIAYAWLGEARSTLPNKGSSPNGEQIGAVADLDLSQEMTSQVLAQFLEGSSLEKVNGAQNLGITLDTYSDVLIACGEKQMPADKDANGKTINGSRKKKVVAYLSDLVQSGTITREQMNYFITTVYGWKL